MKKKFGSICLTCFLIILPAVIIAMIVLSAVAVSQATTIINEDVGETMSAGLSSGVEYIEKELAKNRKVSEALAAACKASYGIYREPNYADMLVGIVATNDSTFGGGIWFEPFKFTDLREYFSPYCMRDSAKKVEYMNNYSLGDGVYYNTQDWYTSAVNLKTSAVWSAPYYDDFAKISMITASSPIYDANGAFIGVATADIDLTSMQEMVLGLSMVDGARSMLIDNTGLYVADADATKQFSMNIANDPNASLVSLGATMLASDSGSASCTVDGKKCKAWYQTVPELGWKLCTIVPENIIYESISALRTRQIMVCVIAILLLCVMIYLTIYSFIVVPIKQVCETTAQIAEGNLQVSMKKIRARHEIKTLVDLLAATVERLRLYDAYINETASVISDIGDGKLDFSLQNDYTGGFSKLKDAMLRIQATLKDTMSAIIVASEQVLLGSRNISAMATNLADSNAEQAMAVDNLSNTIAEISETIHETAINSQKADEVSAQVNEAVVRGNEQMHSMVAAMEEISSSSDEIGKIIKTIDDIAFQTNILALNAAVEAARAGEAGKGFAVVADEVRNLAQKSADAAKNTTGLIENSLRAVSGGSKIAKDTASSLSEISDNASESIKLIGEIARVSGEQADSIAVVSNDIREINRVVQTNSAAAQESSAAGSDLMNQADTLKTLADHFRLS